MVFRDDEPRLSASTSLEPRPSPFALRWAWLVRAFTWYARRFVARHFHALRLARQGADPALPAGPVVVALTHPSWWDPLVAAVLMSRLEGRVGVGAMDARALARYRFMGRLGLFGVEPGTRAGWERLLAVADEAFSRPEAALWITPQGRFTDVRERPLRVKGGVGHLAHRLRRGAVLPVAVEYPFWDERLPEALVRLGEPIPVEDGSVRSPEAWTEAVARALEATQDALAADSARRDPRAFVTLVEGRGGVTWIYDAMRRLGAWLRGRSFDPSHGGLAREAGR